MINYNFYKIFNPDLKKLSNNQLLIHFRKSNLTENKIYSIETFFNKYPYFDCDQYKLYNIDIIINDKYELMYHWHSIGLNENRICSDKYFNIIYPNFQIPNNVTNIYAIKNIYHKDKLNNNNTSQNNIVNDIQDTDEITDKTILSNILIDSNEKDTLNNKRYDNNFLDVINTEVNKNNLKLNYLLNPNKDIISIYILNKSNINFVLKSLSLLNYHEMNIIFLSEKITFFNDINIFNNFERKDDKIVLFNLSDYIISDNLEIILSDTFKINLINDDLKNVKKIFIPNNLIPNNLIPNNLIPNNIIYIDNTFNNFFLQNNILISNYNYYTIKKNKLYKINRNNIDTEKLINKLYVNQCFLNNYSYKEKIFDLFNNIKIINFNSQEDLLNYGIIYDNNNYYYKISNQYLLCDLSYIQYNLPIDIEYIYVEKVYNNIIETPFFLNLKINIIFIINEDNIKYYESNIKYILKKEEYNNYNIIIFFNNISIKDLDIYKEYDNIYTFNSKKKILNIDIILFLTKLADDNSLIIIIDNTSLINPLFSLNYINLLFIARKLLITDYYSNDLLNILIFKKELLLSIKYNFLSNVFGNNDKNYLIILYRILKKNSFNNNYLKMYDYDLDNELNINFIDNYNIYEIFTIDQYLSVSLKNYSLEKVVMLFDKNININESIIDDKLIENKINKINNNINYLDILLYLYRINKINYQFFENNLNMNIKRYNSKYQVIIFINNNYNNTLLNKRINKLLNNTDIQINIIHFDYIYNDIFENYNINYIFLDITNIDNKYINNKLLAYNIVLNIFQKNYFEYKYIIIYNIDSDNIEIDNIDNIDNKYIEKLNINNIYVSDNLNTIILDKNLPEIVGNFDPEIFTNNNSGIVYFIEKINKLDYINKIFLKDDCNITNILKVIDDQNILLDFFYKKNLIDYNIFNKIKTVIINLEDRKDRLNEVIGECHKIELYNFEIFNGIKINDQIYSKLLNRNKIWKRNNSDYFKSALGCKLSHLGVLKKYINISEEYLMILEDDIIFENNILTYLNLALFSLKNKNWDILYLSTNLKVKDDATKINNNLLKINKGLTTTGQIFKTKNIKKIIDIIEKSEIEIDNTYNKYLDNKFCIYPMMAYQRRSYSDINKEVLDYGEFHKKFTY